MRRRATRLAFSVLVMTGTVVLIGCEHKLSGAVSRLLAEQSHRPRIAIVYRASTVEDFAPISSGDTVSYGTVEPGQSATMIFRIENNGDAPLELTGTPLTSIAGSDAFEVTEEPTSPVDSDGGTTEFAVTFAPSESAATASATVEIASDDPNNGLFRFGVAGSCESSGVDYDGAALSVTYDTFGDGVERDATIDLGAEHVTYALSRSFTITNSGDQELALTGPPYVSLTENNAFTVATQPSASVAPGETTSFTIEFLPDDLGLQINTVLIESNDRNDASFSFGLEATGMEFSGTKMLYFVYDAASLDLDVVDHRIVITAQTQHNGNQAATLIESTDGGLNFTEIPGSEAALAQDSYLDTVVAGDVIHVVGLDSESDSVIYSRTDDHGVTWTHTTVVSGGTIGDVSLVVRNPALPEADLFVSYYASDTDAIRVSSSGDGTSWSAPAEGPAEPAGVHRLVDDGTTLHLGHLNDSGEFVYSTSADGQDWNSTAVYSFCGAPPETDRTVSGWASGSDDVLFTYTLDAPQGYDGMAYNSSPDYVWRYALYGNAIGYSDIAADGTVACVAAYDRDNKDLLFYRTGDYTTTTPTWDRATVTSEGDIGISCKTAIDGNRAYVVAAEAGSGILFAKSLNGGMTWD